MSEKAIIFHCWTKAWNLAQMTFMPYYFRILIEATLDFDASTNFCNIQNGCHRNKKRLFRISWTVSHKTLTLGLIYTYPGIINSNMVYGLIRYSHQPFLKMAAIFTNVAISDKVWYIESLLWHQCIDKWIAISNLSNISHLTLLWLSQPPFNKMAAAKIELFIYL